MAFECLFILIQIIGQPEEGGRGCHSPKSPADQYIIGRSLKHYFSMEGTDFEDAGKGREGKGRNDVDWHNNILQL
jgi:hypothetical protein